MIFRYFHVEVSGQGEEADFFMGGVEAHDHDGVGEVTAGMMFAGFAQEKDVDPPPSSPLKGLCSVLKKEAAKD
jgi:hypothetical protein